MKSDNRLSGDLIPFTKEEYEQKEVDFHNKYTPCRLRGKAWVEQVHTVACMFRTYSQQTIVLYHGVSRDAYDVKVEINRSKKGRITFKVDGVKISRRDLGKKLDRTLYYPREVITWDKSDSTYHFCKTKTAHLLEVRNSPVGWFGIIIAGKEATTEKMEHSICYWKKTAGEAHKEVEKFYRDLEDE